MKRFILVLAAIAMFGAGVTVPLLVRGETDEHDDAAGIKMIAQWVYPATSIQQLVSDADVIALATAGPTRRGRSVQPSGGLPPLEFELIDFTTDAVVKGVPGNITVERVAGTQRGAPVVISHDGGSFTPRSVHLLFLKQQRQDPYFILLNDQARYAVQQDRLQGLTDGVVSKALNGKSVTEGLALIKELVGNR